MFIWGPRSVRRFGADIFVAPWDLITPPGVMHYHFAIRSRILCARQALSFHAEGADSTPSSSSAVQSPPIRACSFFPFFPFIQTCQLRCCCRRRFHLASPSHRRYPVSATLKKASDKSFPLFFPFVFNGAGHLPSTQAHCTPCGTQAPTPPPLTCMQAALSPLLSPQPPPPQCLYKTGPPQPHP